MRNAEAKKIRQNVRRVMTKSRKEAINDWCCFINSSPLKRRIKLAFLVIGGKIDFNKLDTI